MMRHWWPDRNPLRRTIDRVESTIMAVLLAVFLAGVPLAALAAAAREAAGGMSAERAQAGWRQVPAVLLQDAPEHAHALRQASLEPLVPARWIAPGGARREGLVYAPGGTRAGTNVMVWTGRSGELEAAPVWPADIAIREVYAGLAAAVLVGAALVVTGLLVRRVLNRRRFAAWDEEWSRMGPQWTGRL